jgi:hypothetical protein
MLPPKLHISYGPVGVGIDAANFHPNTFSHQRFVAPGSALTSSVCEMKPFRILRAAGGAAFAGRLFLPVVFFRVGLFVAMDVPFREEGDARRLAA